MKEGPLDYACGQALQLNCPGIVVYKINDRQTGGIPDKALAWNGYQSWIEFKHLGPGEDLHKALEKIQRVELIKLERQLHGRAWLVIYRKAPARGEATTEIYRPSALEYRGQPVVPALPLEYTQFPWLLQHVRTNGVVRLPGYNHQGVVTLIHHTHRSQA